MIKGIAIFFLVAGLALVAISPLAYVLWGFCVLAAWIGAIMIRGIVRFLLNTPSQ